MYQVIQNAPNNSTTGATFTSTMPQAQPRRLETCIQRFEKILAWSAEMANDFEVLATQLAGPEPEAGGVAGNSPPAPNTLIGTLESTCSGLEGRLTRIQSALNRVKNL